MKKEFYKRLLSVDMGGEIIDYIEALESELDEAREELARLYEEKAYAEDVYDWGDENVD